MSAPFPVRLTSDERTLLLRVAAAHDRKPSALLRHLLKQEARRLGLLDAEGAAPAAPAVAQTPDRPGGDDDVLSWD